MFFKTTSEQTALEIMKNFAEGNMSTVEFWDIYKTNASIRALIVNDKKRPSERMLYFNAERLLEVIDINKLEHRAAVYTVISNYFRRRNERLNFYNHDSELFSELLEIQPSWLDIQDENFLLEIFNSTPLSLNTVQKKKWRKEKIKTLFTYDVVPPDWLQNPEWPIVDGKPLVFKKQVEDIESNKICYYFYDPKTQNEMIIEQFD
jgi:hypothetical protein